MKQKPDAPDTQMNIGQDFAQCSKAFIAIGNELRQNIIAALLESGCAGLRVGAIEARIHLSRTAIAHHLKLMMEAGIINMRQEGTKHYYYVDADSAQWMQLQHLLEKINLTLGEDAKQEE